MNQNILENITIKSLDETKQSKNVINRDNWEGMSMKFYENSSKNFIDSKISKNEGEFIVDRLDSYVFNNLDEKSSNKNTDNTNNNDCLSSPFILNKNNSIMELNSINDINISDNTSHDLHFNDYNINLFNTLDFEIHNNIIQYKDDNSGNSINNNIEKEKNLFPLDLRKDIFKVIYPGRLVIFHKGENDSYPRNLINKIVNTRNIFVISTKSFKKKNKPNNKRKSDPDNIRKKIKARFLKSLKNTINKRLKKAGANYFFHFLPQNFICNVKKKENKDALHLTFKEIFSKNFGEDKDNIHKSYIEKIEYNIKVINYLEKNRIIGKISNYIYFKNMEYFEIYEEYLKSKEFEMDIIKLKEEESDDYIKKYIKLAFNLNNFFSEDI